MIKMKVKKPKRRYDDRSRKKRNEYNLKWITNKYKTGDLDLDKKSHRIMAKIAASKGLIPQEVFDED